MVADKLPAIIMFNFLHRFFIFAAGCLFSTIVGAMPATEFLSVDQAFHIKAQIISPTEFTVDWTIAPKYHLYSDSISVHVLSPRNVRLASLVLPKGVAGTDPNHSSGYQEYYHTLILPVQLTGGSTTGLNLTVSYQGCADAGLCYPPQTKKITLSEMSDDKLADLIDSSNDANRIDHLLQNQTHWMVLLSFFIFGLLLAFTPCVFPMLPILSGIIAGQGHKITPSRAFIFSLVYVLASAATYAVAGIFAGFAGHHLQSMLQNEWVISISGLVFIILAMSLFDVYELQLPVRIQNILTHLSHPKRHGTLSSAAIMGVFSTLIISPCVSAPLVGALAYIGDTGSPAFGGLALFVMGLGMGLPLLIVGTSAGKLLPKAGRWMGSVKKIFGIILVGMALWLWSRIVPAPIILGLSGILMITCAIYLGVLESIKKGWGCIWKIIGIVVGLYGLCLIVGAVSGSTSLVMPLDHVSIPQMIQKQMVRQNRQFIRIENVTQLHAALGHHHQPTLLDFSAEWCAACHEMEEKVFSDPQVKEMLATQHYQLLQVDVTIPNPENEKIMKVYQVLAPPTVVFFDQTGKWLKQKNLVGGQSAEEFLHSLP